MIMYVLNPVLIPAVLATIFRNSFMIRSCLLHTKIISLLDAPCLVLQTNGSGDGGHPCFVPDLSGKTTMSVVFIVMFTLSFVPRSMLKYILSLLHILIRWVWFCLVLLQDVEICQIMVFLFGSINSVQHTHTRGNNQTWQANKPLNHWVILSSSYSLFIRDFCFKVHHPIMCV